MAKRVVVIGGGAAGMMAAGQAATAGAEVILLERMKRLGSKIAISGKGRCNLTNAGDISSFVSYYPGNGKFLYAALKEFDNEALIRFFKNVGVETKVERGGRVFPVADDSEVIVNALKMYLERTGAQIRLNQDVKEVIIENGKVNGIKLASMGEPLAADAVIMATGGASYPGTGSNGDGFVMAAKTGHKLIKPLPALVPLKTYEGWPKQLQGLTLKNVTVSIWVDEKKQGEEFGEMLFTHFGVSGPIILTLSRIASKALDQKQKVALKLNLKPALTPEQMDLRLQRDFAKYCNKQFKNALDDLLPQSLIPVMVDLSGIDPDKVVNKITKEERKRLCRLFQDMPLIVTATLGMATAIVTCGGVDVKQINPTTMESRLVNGLYFAGELIDIDGVTGGYNLQAAFATGCKAGRAAAKLK